MKEVESAVALEDRGLEGCHHARLRSWRQLLMMEAETLAKLDLTPGEAKENVTVSGIDLKNAKLGTRLRVGEAEVEITAPCHPCSRMEEIRPGLQKALEGQRGVLCRIVKSGRIRRGDPIQEELPGEAHQDFKSKAKEEPLVR